MSKEFYITINGQKVPVTEEVYRAYKRPLWAEHKRKERAKRCRSEDGNRCTNDCSNCPHDKTGSVLSLDALAATGSYEPFDHTDLSDLIAHKELLEQLDLTLGKLSKIDRKIIALYLNGYTERSIADKVDLAQKTVNNHKRAALEMLRERLIKFR